MAEYRHWPIAIPAASFIVMCWTASSDCGPEILMSPMWLTSKTPTPVRTARCSFIRPPCLGYSTGMSQPLKSTIFAPSWRWTAFNAVLRTIGVDGVSGDTMSLRRPAGAAQDGVTKYGNTRFFTRSTTGNARLYYTLRRYRSTTFYVWSSLPQVQYNLVSHFSSAESLAFLWGTERLPIMSAPSVLNSEAESKPVTRMESVRPKTVLCVDDEKIGLRVRKIMLESRGYAVLTATSGPEGLKVFDENQVDLVLLDYFMPDLNGGEVASEMRRRPA